MSSVLGTQVFSTGYIYAVAGYIREFRDRLHAARQMTAPPPNYGALSALADLVEGLELEDSRLFALSQLQREQGIGEERFEPGSRQQEFLARNGDSWGSNPPLAEDALNQLVTAAVEDFISFTHARISDLGKQNQVARQEAVALDGANEAATEARERAQNLESELGATKAEIANLSDQNELLRKHGNGQPKKQRRKVVPGETGIYATDTANGTKYEIGWTEDGVQRWKTIGPDLDEARKARQEVAA